MQKQCAKKIMILTERFYPEEFLINDLAAELNNSEDCTVEILTQTPSYPHRRFQILCLNLRFRNHKK